MKKNLCKVPAFALAIIVVLILTAGQLFAATVTKLTITPLTPCDPNVGSWIYDDWGTPKWEGFGTYDILELKVVPTWSDGVADPDCTRAGTAPAWQCTKGWFEAAKTNLLDYITQIPAGMVLSVDKNRYKTRNGAQVQWSTVLIMNNNVVADPNRGIYKDELLADQEGEITVSYGGVSTKLKVKIKKHNTDNEGSFYQSVHVLSKGDMFDFAGKDRAWREAYYGRQVAKAQKASDDLKAYIKDWLAGRVGAELPMGLLPEGLNTIKSKWSLAPAGSVDPKDQWGCRPTNVVPADHTEQYQLGPDNGTTYLHHYMIAPFGATLEVEGDFPYARCMFYEITPVFDPRFPWTIFMGNMEVPMADVDIEPDAGHVNPFRVGANRLATNRHYHVYFKTARCPEDNPPYIMNQPAQNGAVVTLNENLNPGSMTDVPHAYRSFGSTNNTRIGSGFIVPGPNVGREEIAPGLLWIRYIMPDKAKGVLGGVGLPRVTQKLDTGERYHVVFNKYGFNQYRRRVNYPQPSKISDPTKPNDISDHRWGWLKVFGGELIAADMLGIALGGMKETIRNSIRDGFGRGYDQPAPGRYSGSGTYCKYHTFFGRWMSLGEQGGQKCVIVMTGKLPTTPKTWNGNATMTAGEARYWSINRMESNGDCGALHDEEIVTPASGINKGWYILCFSKQEARPNNAYSQNGVTWQSWGNTQDSQNMLIRWCTVSPEWNFSKSPDDVHLPWLKAEWSSPEFDGSLTFANKRDGFLQEYQTVLHYMTKPEFESLGSSPDPQAIPHSYDWPIAEGGCGSVLSGTVKQTALVVLLPMIIALCAFNVWLFGRKRKNRK